MLIGGAAVWLLRGAAMRVFTNDPLVISVGGSYLAVAAAIQAAYPILFSTVFLMQGLKRPTYGLWIGLYRQVAAPLLIISMLAVLWGGGLPGIWRSIFIVNWSAAAFAFWWGWRATRTVQSGRAMAENADCGRVRSPAATA
jgi:Na+-driven multidrug efflux pump